MKNMPDKLKTNELVRQSNFSYEPKFFRCVSPEFKKSSIRGQEMAKVNDEDKISVLSRNSQEALKFKYN